VTETDVDFIAHARQDVPALLAICADSDQAAATEPTAALSCPIIRRSRQPRSWRSRR
jgi:hypothetical protein